MNRIDVVFAHDFLIFRKSVNIITMRISQEFNSLTFSKKSRQV